jgi:hypothetical protein
MVSMKSATELPIDDTLTVGLVERVGDLDGPPHRLVERQGTPGEPLGRRLSFQMLHDHEVGTVLATDVAPAGDRHSRNEGCHHRAHDRSATGVVLRGG